ncbi:thiamine-phosphate kinase [Paenibacillus flagellatus]|uniref:Thiamine-monophosphate kinase n=2 Tax=Paenibacillus flagellatus TaxID=2211139 RepID=A0A2V5K1Q0_9BACL|nr:thiamine-phosphate kinase [Paenibacillus flagellatus]
MDEFALIRRLNRPRSDRGAAPAASGVKMGIGDDAAVLRPSSGRELVVSCDTMVETVHFKPETMRSDDIGYKAMAAALSDLAAMGAEPRWALVALTVPPQSWTADELRELYDGLYACADRYGVAVVGGDTTSSPAGLTVTVTVIGEAADGRSLLRSAAEPGDAVFVTGPLGGSAAGLHALLARGERAGPIERLPEPLQPLVRAHRRPEPRFDAARLLAAAEPGVCGALNDVSDGLASEAREIAEASGVRIALDGASIPLADELSEYAASVGADPLEWALYGGEDFELVGTVRRDRAEELAAAFERAGRRIWFVGQVSAAAAEDGAAVTIVREPGGAEVPLAKNGYNHFA